MLKVVGIDNVWIIERDDGSRLELSDRPAIWRSEDAANAYLEFIQCPKPRVSIPTITPRDAIENRHAKLIADQRRALTASAREALKAHVAAKFGVTVQEMMVSKSAG